MWYKTTLNEGYKIYRESTSGVTPIYKPNQGSEVTNQADDGEFTSTNHGDEQGWVFLDKAGARTMGSWVQVCPAMYNTSTGTVRPMKDKTQAVDTDYATKSLSSSAGNSFTHVRLAEIAGGGASIPGLIAACPNHASQELVFFPLATSITISYARIAWNFTTIEDYSEGELLTYDPLTDRFVASGATMWVDSWRSIPNLVFTTAGDGTIFEVQKIGSVTRRNATRDLYVAKKCIVDEGDTITYLQGNTTYSSYSNRLDVTLTKGPGSWNTPETSAIRTSILTQTKKNNLSVIIAENWYGSGQPEEFKWARIQTYSPIIVAPIRPILYSRDQKLFKDLITYGNNQTISYYRAS